MRRPPPEIRKKWTLRSRSEPAGAGRPEGGQLGGDTEPGAAGNNAENRLDRARRLGHRVVPRMIRAAPGPHRVQRVEADVKFSKGKVFSALVTGNRPPGNLRSGTGDHTTPYVTFEHMARNNVLGFTPKQAAKNLVIVLQRIQEMPGYANSGGATRKNLDVYAEAWIKKGKAMEDPDEQDLEELMKATVSLRNAIPMTAYKHPKSSGGHGEGTSAGGLEWAEHLVRIGTWTKKSDFKGDPIHNVWKTFDFSAPILGGDADKWAAVLRQHMMSIRESYPRLFEISGLYSMEDMESYLKEEVLEAKFERDLAEEIAGKL